MYAVAMSAVLATMVLALYRAILGPTVNHRILAVSMAGTKTLLLIAVLGFLTGRPAFLDLAVIYSMLGFVITIAVVKYVEFGSLSSAADPEPET